MKSDLEQHVRAWEGLRRGDGPKGHLVVRVLGLAPGRGQAMVGLYDAGTPFPREGKHLTAIHVPATNATEVTFEDVPHGRYAVAVIHDLNSNGRLDMRLGFLPAEPLGFSNGARVGWFGPPRFEAAAFDLRDRTLAIAVEVR